MIENVLINLGNHIKQNISKCLADEFHEDYCELMEKSDTSDVWRQFAIWFLVDPDDGVLRFTKPDSLEYNTIQQVAQLYIEDCKDAYAWEEANSAAYSAGYYAAWAAASFALTAASFALAAAWVAANYMWNKYNFGYNDYAPIGAVINAAKCYAFDDAGRAHYHYKRMADKLIKLLEVAPLINKTQHTHCKTIANKPDDLINRQEGMVDDMNTRGENGMDNSEGNISFSISHHNGTTHILHGKEAIEKEVFQIESALSVVKALLKDNPSYAININFSLSGSTITITYGF